jgi:hypothetical protein
LIARPITKTPLDDPDAVGFGTYCVANHSLFCGDTRAWQAEPRRSTSMLTRKKSIRSRTRLARRKQPKFVNPDLVLFAGQKFRFVAEQDNALSEAERLRGEYAEMEDDHHAEVRQFLQHAYGVAVRFRRQLGDFERLKAHPFWDARERRIAVLVANSCPP